MIQRCLRPELPAGRDVAVSSPSAMLSSSAVTVTVWAVFQFTVVKVSVVGLAATSSLVSSTVTVTVSVGCDFSTTV